MPSHDGPCFLQSKRGVVCLSKVLTVTLDYCCLYFLGIAHPHPFFVMLDENIFQLAELAFPKNVFDLLVDSGIVFATFDLSNYLLDVCVLHFFPFLRL